MARFTPEHKERLNNRRKKYKRKKPSWKFKQKKRSKK